MLLLLVALGLCCCVPAAPGSFEQGLLSSCGMQASHCGGVPCWDLWALHTWASVVVMHGLSCPKACGIFPDQGSNLCPPALAGGFLTTGSPGKSCLVAFN